MIVALIFTALVFLLGLGFVYVSRQAARRCGLVAAPRPDRWHSKPTALMGGVGIYAAFAIGYACLTPQSMPIWSVFIAGSVMFAIGLVDDLISLKPYTKLIVQLLVAIGLILAGLQLQWTASPPLNVCLTILWLVGITNAINLLDNMDGLAGGISCIACAFLSITFVLNGQGDAAMISAMLGAVSLAFLFFNFAPASIFMGDSGSMFLGCMLGSLALLSDDGGGTRSNVGAVLLTPVLIMAIPIFDTCVVTITRKIAGRPVSQGGRDHTSHRLVALGMSERRAVLYLYSFALISGVLALLVRWLNMAVTLWLVPAFALMILFLGFYLGKVRIAEAESVPPGSAVLASLFDFAYKRRVFEVLLDMGLMVLAYYGAYLLRYDGNLPSDQMAIFSQTLPLVLAAQMTAFLVWGVYRGLWHYVSVPDLVLYTQSVITGGLLSGLLVLGVNQFSGPSRAVLILNPVLLLVAVSASRFSFRFMQSLLVGTRVADAEAKPVLIYGAGDGGELLLRELLSNVDRHYTPVGFLDDDARKIGQRIHGLPIFDPRWGPNVAKTSGVEEVLVSSWKIPDSKLDRLSAAGLYLKRMRLDIESRYASHDLRS
ncbi:hypothetical protein [Candidatus Entotheonella palauensis]|uniref:hypothetical protein n=1 Tax=Candidatus Entotheonella palauensis TaxID=93172 RepID=UPI000B7CF649|nr:hypothetical protein [Candidatus Entotheonella palauensis]